MSFLTLCGIACFLAGMLCAGLILSLACSVAVARERRREDGVLETLKTPRPRP